MKNSIFILLLTLFSIVACEKMLQNKCINVLGKRCYPGKGIANSCCYGFDCVAKNSRTPDIKYCAIFDKRANEYIFSTPDYITIKPYRP